MSGALNTWRTAVAAQLTQHGITAASAMESARAPRWREAAAAVSLSGVACAPGGFQDYLGLREGPDGRSREVYGREAELTLSLDVFAPRDGGEGACLQTAEAAAECLVCQGAAGLPALEVRMGRVEFLEQEGLYRLPVTCRCKAWLIARLDEEAGTFTDFEVKGRLK